MSVEIVCTDVLDWAKTYDGPPFHAILTDPPYELGFMGKSWDRQGVAFQPETWAALAAHLLPGAHVLAFGGSRTHHRLMCAIEDAGLEIRDCIYYCFGSGFPKSLNVGKAIDKAAGADREVVGTVRAGFGNRNGKTDAEGGVMLNSLPEELKHIPITAPATPAAATWEGYGSALKPAVEVIVMARKPLEGTIAANCERYGSGALNIDESRIGIDSTRRNNHGGTGNPEQWRTGNGDDFTSGSPAGRWPANLVLQHSPGCKRVGTKRVKGNGNPYHRTAVDNDGKHGPISNAPNSTLPTTAYADPFA